jgi:hypothetical protein
VSFFWSFEEANVSILLEVERKRLNISRTTKVAEKA